MIHRFFSNLCKGDAPMWFWAAMTVMFIAGVAFGMDALIDWIFG